MNEHERFEQEANYYVPTQEHSQYILSALAYSEWTECHIHISLLLFMVSTTT